LIHKQVFLQMRNRQPATAGILRGIFRGIAFGALVVALPVTAFGAEPSGGTSLVAIGTATVAIVILFLLIGLLTLACAKLRSRLAWAHRDLLRASRFEAILSALPGGLLWWDRSTDAKPDSKDLCALLGIPEGTKLRLSNVLGCLEKEAGENLKKAVTQLQEEGTEFTLSVAAADSSRNFEAMGLRVVAEDGAELADLLWLRETTIEKAEAK
jgi:hypothetical protein